MSCFFSHHLHGQVSHPFAISFFYPVFENLAQALDFRVCEVFNSNAEVLSGAHADQFI